MVLAILKLYFRRAVSHTNGELCSLVYMLHVLSESNMAQECFNIECMSAYDAFKHPQSLLWLDAISQGDPHSKSLILCACIYTMYVTVHEKTCTLTQILILRKTTKKPKNLRERVFL